MLFKKINYLDSNVKCSPNEFLANSLLFYFLPNFILLVLFNFNFFNYISYFVSFFIFILYPIFALIYLLLNFVTSLKVIRFLNIEFKENYSWFKKIVLFILLQIPFALHANLATIFFAKKYPKIKYPLFFIINYCTLFLSILLLRGLVLSVMFGNYDKKLKPELRPLALSAIFGGYNKIMNPSNGSTEKEVKTTKVHSEYVGKSYTLKRPYFIMLNLPKGSRDHSDSVKVAEGKFVQFQNDCGNCLDSQRLEKPIRLHYLPIGSKITVVDAFVLGRNFFKTDPDRIYLIIQDDVGHLAEITTLGFKVNFLKEKSSNFDYHVSLLNLIKEIEVNHFVDQLVCAEKNRSEPRLVQDYPFKYSTQVERKIYRFIKDFDLKDQVEISTFSTAQNSYDSLSCAQVRFKTINSISLYFYYAMDWGLSNNTYTLDEYTKIQKTPFSPISYREFIRLNDADILKTYP